MPTGYMPYYSPAVGLILRMFQGAACMRQKQHHTLEAPREAHILLP